MDTSSPYVDCSDNNNNDDGSLPDLDAYAAAGHTQLVIKATEGTGYTWVDSAKLHDRAHELGLVVGRYHWLRPDQGSATDQARFFVDAIEEHLHPGDWIMTDWERTYVKPGPHLDPVPVPEPPDQQWAQVFLDFTAEVERLLPNVWFPTYTGNWYLDGRSPLQEAARTRPIVIADYSNDPAPNPYRLNYVAQQFTSAASVAGFARGVDYNRWLAPSDRLPHTMEDDMQDADWQKFQTMLDAHFDRTSTMVANGLIALRTGKTAGQFTEERKRLVDGQGIDGRLHNVRADVDEITAQLHQIQSKIH